ncbi:glycosyltransferase [Leptolyngbya ohadii]|uniref:glycosyltransferase n=1 Tax=Leptolyngbya ohadii TaxID=1962290 RepID=UPI0021F13386|nr:glycosyltransferase [Leptolyngbya ohadii]
MSASIQPLPPTPDSSDRTIRLAVVVLNYRTADLTIGCLKSLVPEIETLPETQVYVVDNCSADGSAEKIAAAIAAAEWQWATFLPLSQNRGYAAGNNAAIRQILSGETLPDYILLLNPDTIVRPGALSALVEFMERHPEAGIAGSRLEDLDGTPQRSAFRFPSVFSELDDGLRLGVVSKLLESWTVAPPVPESECETDWVAGASMIVRRSVWEQVGLMDEDYFLYFEELDFCLAAKRSGWSCWYVPQSRVVHFVGQSSGVTDTKIAPKRRPTYWFDSRRRYFTKNYGWWYAVLSEILWAVSFALWRVRRAIQRKPDTDPPYLLVDFVRNSVLVKTVVGNRGAGGTAAGEQGRKTSQSESYEPEYNPELGLWEQIREDWEAHGRDWTLPGFRAVAVQRFGVWRMTVKPKILRAPLSILYRSLYRKIRNSYGIELPFTVKLGRRVVVEHHSGIIIHGYSTIGDESIIRQGVTLGIRYLDRPFDAPKLGKRVNVGAGAVILGNVEIGDDANIGANAVVLSDVPAGCTAVGIPAKILPTKAKMLREGL